MMMSSISLTLRPLKPLGGLPVNDTLTFKQGKRHGFGVDLAFLGLGLGIYPTCKPLVAFCINENQ